MPPEIICDFKSTGPRAIRIAANGGTIEMLRYTKRTDGRMGFDILTGDDMVCLDLTVSDAEAIIKYLQGFVAYAKTETIEVPARHAAAVRDFIKSIDR